MTARLDTTYLGLELAHPVVASASPLGRTFEGISKLAEAGAAAIVMPSLFEEQIDHEAAEIAGAYDMGTEIAAALSISIQ